MAFWSLTKQEPEPDRPTAAAATMDAATLKEQLGHAYRRGRTDQKTRNLGRGLMMTGLLVLAAVGVLFLGLGARDGSFAAAGGEVDQATAQAMASLGVVR